MHSHSLDSWTHDHVFLGENHRSNERRTWSVVALTATMMVVEIGGGSIFGSMALMADGWHMSTHVLALGIAALAYRFAHRHARDARFAFGTGKLGDLAAFASAIILAMIAIYIGVESVDRLVRPIGIGFGEAIPIAIVGLFVNVASVWLLHDGHHDDGHHDAAHHHHHHDHEDHHSHGHHPDTNMRAAYVHVLADALTSVLAIVALLGGRYLGLSWLDPVMGLAGTLVIAGWAFSLVKTAGATLLDIMPDDATAHAIRERLETGGDRVTDLHLWQIGPGHRSAIISIISDNPLPPAAYKSRLSGLGNLSHVTVEVETCPDHASAA